MHFFEKLLLVTFKCLLRVVYDVNVCKLRADPLWKHFLHILIFGNALMIVKLTFTQSFVMLESDEIVN